MGDWAATRRLVSTLHPIVAIVGRRTQSEMVWPHTQSDIANVAHHQVGGDRPEVHRVADSMYPPALAVDLDVAVTPSWQPVPGPQPATASLVDTCPEPRGNGAGAWRGTRARAVAKLVGLPAGFIRSAACLADSQLGAQVEREDAQPRAVPSIDALVRVERSSAPRANVGDTLRRHRKLNLSVSRPRLYPQRGGTSIGQL